MPKQRLMTPGPTPVPEDTLLDLARPVIHHRTPEFRRLFAEVLEDLKYVFQTTNDVIVLTSSGTGAMEAAVVNTVPRGGKALVLDAGRFAQRWAEICDAFGIHAISLKVPWGQTHDPADVARTLREHPDTVAVLATLCETSTGVGHDIAALGRIVAQSPAVLAVDCISGLGSIECRTDDWGLDLVVTGSQKALMLPPGLAFLSVSRKAWAKIEAVSPQAFYFDLRAARRKLADQDTPFTPAHTLIAALRTSLRRIRARGLENILADCRTLGEATRAGILAMGLELFAARPADGLTAVKLPTGIPADKLLGRLKDRFGVALTGGQDALKGKIFRIAHMGYIDELDVLGALAAVELVLHELGHPVQLGRAVTAAQKVLAATQTKEASRQ